MKIDISRREMEQVLLAKVAEMDPEEAREELWEHYEQNVYPNLTDEQLAAEFYEKLVVSELVVEDEDEVETVAAHH